MRFLNMLFYFGSGNVVFRVTEHFKIAVAMLSGAIFQNYFQEFHSRLSVHRLCDARLARMYATASQRKKETSSQEIGSTGPAVSTLFVTHNRDFAYYAENCLINWIGQSRVNVYGQKSISVSKIKNSDFAKDQHVIIIHLIGQLLSTCSMAVVEMPARLFNGALFSIYSEHTPCFHRYALLEDKKGDLSVSLPLDFPPTRLTLIPIEWVALTTMKPSKKFDSDIYQTLMVRINATQFLISFFNFFVVIFFLKSPLKNNMTQNHVFEFFNARKKIANILNNCLNC